MGNCYIFNPANGLLQVTLNGVYLGKVYPADPSVGYQPQSIVTLTARHDDGFGYLAISDPNTLSVYYPDRPPRPRVQPRSMSTSLRRTSCRRRPRGSRRSWMTIRSRRSGC